MNPIKKIYLFGLSSLILLFYTSVSSAQSGFQKLDDKIMIDLQQQRTPEQTGVFLFLSRTHLYGDIGIPAGLLAGGIIIENVFFLPGLGRLVFQSISARDLIVVKSVVMLLVFAVIFVNFLVDVSYAFVDPRLRRQR